MADPKKPSGNIIMDDRDQFLLPLSRIDFPNLFIPTVYQEGDKPKYNATLIFPPEETFDEYKKAIARLRRMPGFNKLSVVPGSPEEQALLAEGIEKEDLLYMSRPIRKENNPEKLEKYPYQKNQYKASVSSYVPPAVLDARKEEIKIGQKELIYSGCYGQALVSVGIFNHKQLFFRLHAFQKQKDGQPFGRANANMDMFKTFADDSSLAEDDGGV